MIKKRVHWPKVKNVVWKVKIQCLPSWDTSADIPSMIKLPSQVPRSNWLAVYVFFLFKKTKPWRNVSLTCWVLFILCVCVCVCVCVSRSVVSDSLWPHGLYSLLGSSIHGILQAWILEWVTIPFSRGSSWPRDQIWVSRVAGRVLLPEPPGMPSLFWQHIKLLKTLFLQSSSSQLSAMLSSKLSSFSSV